jgi:monoamine oxidase
MHATYSTRFRLFWLFVFLSMVMGCKSVSGDRSSRVASGASTSPSSGCLKEGLTESRNSLHSGSADARHFDVALGGDSLPADASTDVVVVGGGLTGLTTAFRLGKQGVKAVVLEADKRVGGRVDTIRFSDCSTAEAHMEEYWQRSPAFPLLKELGFVVAPEGGKLPAGTPEWKILLEDVAHSSVRLDNKIHPYHGEGDIDDYLNGIFTPEESEAFKTWSAQMWTEYEGLHAWHKSQDEAIINGQPNVPMPPRLEALTKISFKQFVETQRINGKPLPRKVLEWIRVTIEPETAIEWSETSALDGLAEFRLFLNSPDGFGERNYHVGSGNINFIRALHEEVLRRGNKVQTDSRVTEIRQDASGVTVLYSRGGVQSQVRAKYVVVTVPLYVINKIKFTPALGDEARSAIASTRYGSYVKVHYRLNPSAAEAWKPFEEPNTYLFTLLSDSPAGSIYNVTDLQNAKGPDAKPITLTLLIHARYATKPQNGAAKSLIQMTPQEAGIHVRKAIDNLFPGISANIIDTATYIYPTAVAYWPLEMGRSRFDDKANALRRPQGPYQRLLIGGDTTEDSHSEGAIAAAERMSKLLLRLLDKK